MKIYTLAFACALGCSGGPGTDDSTVSGDASRGDGTRDGDAPSGDATGAGDSNGGDTLVLGDSNVDGDSSGVCDPIEEAGVSLSVCTTEGRVLGYRHGAVWNWRGVPFAAPPQRWRAPVPPPARSIELDASSFGAMCPQPADPGPDLPPEDCLNSGQACARPAAAEDCLYINVWSPAVDGVARPVMVWFHGGGFVIGAGSDQLGHHLAAAGDVVVVSVNYRLGALGFLAHPEFTDGGANYGLLDSLEALRWVQANIGAFGGDPNSVTIFGESAGAGVVLAMLASPLADGLFHRAAAQSAPYADGLLQYDLTTANNLATSFADYAGCVGTPTAQLACLEGLSTQELVDPYSSVAALFISPNMLAPVTDGVLLPQTARELIRDNNPKPGVPVLIGTNRDEGALPIAAMVITEGFSEPPDVWLRGRFGDTAGNAVAALYDAAWYPPSPIGGLGITPERRVVIEVINDGFFYRGAGHFVEDRAHTNLNPVFVYHYLPSRVSSITGIAGAAHGEELALLFGLVTSPDAQEQLLIDSMQAYWTAFARTGTPSPLGREAWPANEPVGRGYLEFDLDDTPAATAIVRADYLEFGDAGDWRPDQKTKADLIADYDAIFTSPYTPTLRPWDVQGEQLMRKRFSNFLSWDADPCWSAGPPIEANVPDHGGLNRVARASACNGPEILGMGANIAVDTDPYCRVTLTLWAFLDGELDTGVDYLDIEVDDGSSWVALDRLDTAAEAWVFQSYDLTPHSNAALRVRFVTNADGVDEDIALDDVTMTGFNGCP